MPKDFKTNFEPFKGQSQSMRLHDGTFIKNLRNYGEGEPKPDKGSLYPFMPKLTQMLFDMPKLQLNPYERITAVFGAEYGSYIELAAIGDPNFTVDGTTAGANIPNRTQTDACMVYDRVKYTANYLYKNVFTHLAYIDQRRGMKGVVLSADQESALAGIAVQSMAQEASIKRKAIMGRLFADCVDGTLTPDADDKGNTKSDGTGVEVDDEALVIKGWAGQVNEKITDVIPEIEYGVEATGIDTENALKLANEIRTALTHGKYLSNYYVPGGYRLDKFTTPVLVLEEGILDLLEKVFMVADIGAGTSAVPRTFNKGWVDYVKSGKSIEILTVDKFEKLPEGSKGTDKRLLAAIVEPDLFKDFVYEDSMDSDKCLQPRGMVYDYQRIEALGIDVRRPSVVFTAPVV